MGRPRLGRHGRRLHPPGERPPPTLSSPCRHQRGRPGSRAGPKDGGGGASSHLRCYSGAAERHGAASPTPTMTAARQRIRGLHDRIRLPPSRIYGARSGGPEGGAGGLAAAPGVDPAFPGPDLAPPRPGLRWTTAPSSLDGVPRRRAVGCRWFGGWV